MYFKNKKTAFTLVELIVVLTIVSILATAGFVAYTNYLKSVRDSSRIQQMSEIHNSLTLYGLRSVLPVPSRGVKVAYGGIDVGIQGYADSNVLKTIQYSDGGLDPKTKNPYIYFMSKSKKSSQLLGYFEERNTGTLFTQKSVFAEEEYSSLYPQVVGDELGILIDADSYVPIQEISEIRAVNNIDVESYSGSLISFMNNSFISEGNGVELISIVPSGSCKDILDTLGTAQDGLYKINLSDNTKTEVYCDMSSDGGGWTYGAFISGDASVYDVFFNAETGNYDSFRGESSNSYSIDISKLYHTEMLIAYNQPDIPTADGTNNLLRFKYDMFTPGFYIGPLYLPNGNAFFGPGGDETGLSYSTSLSGLLTPTNRDRFGAAGWGIGSNAPDIPYLIRIGTGNGGVYKYPEVWGDTITPPNNGNSAYVYVR